MFLQLLSFTCFAQDAKCIVQQQSDNILLILNINNQLSIRDQKLCDELLNLQGTLSVNIGNHEFSNYVQYNGVNLSIILEQSETFDINEIKDITLGTYQVQFDESSLVFEDSISQLFWKVYDDSNCILEAYFTYETRINYGVQFVPNQICNPIPSDDVQLNLYINSQRMLTQLIPKGEFVFKSLSFLNITCTEDNVSCILTSVQVGGDVLVNGEIEIIIPQTFQINITDFDEATSAETLTLVSVNVPLIYRMDFTARKTPDSDCYHNLTMQFMQKYFVISGIVGEQIICNNEFQDNRVPGGYMAIQIIIIAHEKVFSMEQIYNRVNFSNTEFLIYCDEKCQEQMALFNSTDRLQIQVGFLYFTIDEVYDGAHRYPSDYFSAGYEDAYFQIYEDYSKFILTQSYNYAKILGKYREIKLKIFETVDKFDMDEFSYIQSYTLQFPTENNEYYLFIDSDRLVQASRDKYIISMELDRNIFISTSNDIFIEYPMYFYQFLVTAVLIISIVIYFLIVYLVRQKKTQH